MITFPAAVIICNEAACIPHVDKAALSRMDAVYCGIDKYSGYEIYMDRLSGKMFAADAW